MKSNNIDKIKPLLQQYLEINNKHLHKEIWASIYSFRENKNSKDKKATNTYAIDTFLNQFELSTDKKSQGYNFWKFIYQKDISLAFEIVTENIKWPSKQYEKEEYIKNIFELYTKNKKENKLVWSIVNTKGFLNNNINMVEKLFEEQILNNMQKQEIVEYYLNLLNKSGKFKTLENKRIVSVLNEQLIKPFNTIELIEEKKLNICATTEKCIYFEIKVEELMAYNLKLSDTYSEHLLNQFPTLLPKVVEAETKDVVTRRLGENNKFEGCGYAILTKLSEDLISKVFISFVESYVKTINNQTFLSEQDGLDCLKFAVIKSRKEMLENKLVVKNIKSPLNKI